MRRLAGNGGGGGELDRTSITCLPAVTSFTTPDDVSPGLTAGRHIP